MKKIIVGIIGLFCVAGGIYSYLYYRVGNTAAFVSAYEEYVLKWVKIEKTVYSPGADSNVVRQNLNSILTRVLDENISEKERFSLAVKGADPLAQIRSEIDAMKNGREELEQSASVLRFRANNVKGIRLRQKAFEIVALSEKRIAMVREIENVSYRMNDTVKEIFQGVAGENGALTDKRKRALNTAVPVAEKDYERLHELYRNMTENKTATKKAYKTFEEFAK
jgi:DNA repair ATPase RecN